MRSEPGKGKLVRLYHLYEFYVGDGLRWTHCPDLAEDYADGNSPIVVKFDPGMTTAALAKHLRELADSLAPDAALEERVIAIEA